MSALEFALWQRYYAAEDEVRTVIATQNIVQNREEAVRWIKIKRRITGKKE